MPPPTLPLRREPRACRNVSRPSGVRTISTCGAPAAVFPPSPPGPSPPVPRRAAGVLSSTFTGVSSAASALSPASAAIIASSNPAVPSRASIRAEALSTQPAETGIPSSMPMTCAARSAGTFPYADSSTAAAFSTGPYDTAPGVQAGRRLRERHRPAARARKPRQQPLGHLPDDLHVNDLRPPRVPRPPHRPGRPAGTALRRRLRVLPLARIRIPLQALALMTGLPAPLAVLPALPLGLLPRPPRFFRPDPLLRRRRPRVRAVHRQPALHLRQPQLQPPFPLQRRFQPPPSVPRPARPSPRSRHAAATPAAARRPHRAHRTRAASMLNLH